MVVFFQGVASKVALQNTENMGLGVVATQDIDPEDEMINVPLSLVMLVQSSHQSSHQFNFCLHEYPNI